MFVLSQHITWQVHHLFCRFLWITSTVFRRNFSSFLNLECQFIFRWKLSQLQRKSYISEDLSVPLVLTHCQITYLSSCISSLMYSKFLTFKIYHSYRQQFLRFPSVPIFFSVKKTSVANIFVSCTVTYDRTHNHFYYFMYITWMILTTWKWPCIFFTTL